MPVSKCRGCIAVDNLFTGFFGNPNPTSRLHLDTATAIVVGQTASLWIRNWNISANGVSDVERLVHREFSGKSHVELWIESKGNVANPGNKEPARSTQGTLPQCGYRVPSITPLDALQLETRWITYGLLPVTLIRRREVGVEIPCLNTSLTRYPRAQAALVAERQPTAVTRTTQKLKTSNSNT